MQNQLKRCPFCGNIENDFGAVHTPPMFRGDSERDYIYVQCLDCGARGPAYEKHADSKEKALKAWNDIPRNLKRMAYLRTLLRWSADQGFCEMPRFPRLPLAEYEKLVPPTPEELAAILEAASPHVRRVIIIGAQLGARVGPSEIFRLTWQDVDLVQGIMRIHGAKKI